MKVSEQQQAVATASMANGQTQSVTIGFRSDTPTVATVSDAGLVTGNANGQANISVNNGGRQGTKTIRVIPDYQGSWSGRYSVTSCSDSGILRDAGGCRTLQGSSLPIDLNMTQQGDTVTARVSFGTLTADSSTSPINSDGGVILNAVVPSPVARIDAVVRLNQTTRGEIAGSVSQNWFATGGFAGTMELSGSITSASRTASFFRTSTSPSSLPKTIQETLQLLR
jgi:hypothetical protein